MLQGSLSDDKQTALTGPDSPGRAWLTSAEKASPCCTVPVRLPAWSICAWLAQDDLAALRRLLADRAGWQLGLQQLGPGSEEGDEDAPVVVEV